MRTFIVYAVHEVLLELSNQGGWDGQEMKHALGDSQKLVRKTDFPVCFFISETQQQVGG
jgi:hypothetical protein